MLGLGSRRASWPVDGREDCAFGHDDARPAANELLFGREVFHLLSRKGAAFGNAEETELAFPSQLDPFNRIDEWKVVVTRKIAIWPRILGPRGNFGGRRGKCCCPQENTDRKKLELSEPNHHFGPLTHPNPQPFTPPLRILQTLPPERYDPATFPLRHELEPENRKQLGEDLPEQLLLFWADYLATGQGDDPQGAPAFGVGGPSGGGEGQVLEIIKNCLVLFRESQEVAEPRQTIPADRLFDRGLEGGREFGAAKKIGEDALNEQGVSMEEAIEIAVSEYHRLKAEP